MSEELIDLLAAANRVVAFTGAGISTNIPGSREVYKWWTSSVVVAEGATISASSTGPYAYTLEFD